VSRYRKIEVRTWSDEKFRALSGIPPSGQGLWFFLLTGPHTTAIPGLFRAGRAGMAEELGWDQEDFDEAFREVSSQGMAKADFRAKLVWLPKAIQHNKPESPNVVRGWRVELDLLPECDLKREALAGIRDSLIAIGSPYVEAFDDVMRGPDRKQPDKAIAKPSPKPSPKPMPNQEQEQEQKKPISSAGADPLPPGFARFWKTWPRTDRKEGKAECLKRWNARGLEAFADEIVAHVETLKGTKKWQDGFEPAPLTFVNQRRWEDAEDGDGEAINGVPQAAQPEWMRNAL